MRKIKIVILSILYSVLCCDLSSAADYTINIDSNIFSETSVRLNREVYNISSDNFNKSRVMSGNSQFSSVLFNSYVQNVDPIIPIALTICETGSWMDTRYVWSSAIYAKPLLNSGADMDSISVERINADTYIVLGLVEYLGCGTNCTGGQHYHYIGKNDNDSLGPLQVLRRYIEPTNGVSYPNGTNVIDLMRWKDNVIFFEHNITSAIVKAGDWNNGIEISSPEYLTVLSGVIHNTGASFISAQSWNSSVASGWVNPKAIFQFAEDLTSEENLRILEEYIKEWYSNAKVIASNNEQFTLPGQASVSELDSVLSRIGVSKQNYANSFNHKQYYPVRALLNYMALKQLYTSGGDE